MTIYQSMSMYQQYICALYPEWPAQCCPSVLPWSLSTQSRSPGGRRPGGWGTPRERKRRSWWWGRGSADSPCWPTQRAAAAAAHYSDAWRCQPSAHLGNPSAAVEGMRRGNLTVKQRYTQHNWISVTSNYVWIPDSLPNFSSLFPLCVIIWMWLCGKVEVTGKIKPFTFPHSHNQLTHACSSSI